MHDLDMGMGLGRAVEQRGLGEWHARQRVLRRSKGIARRFGSIRHLPTGTAQCQALGC